MEEISLKEIIQILIKQRRLIIITTVASMILGFVYCRAMPKKYEATATLLANPISRTAPTNTTQVVENFVSSFGGQNSQMDISTYMEQIVSLDLLAQTIETLSLTDKNKNLLLPEALLSKIKITVVDKTNLMKITATDSDPQAAADIANVLSLLFIEYITELSREQSLMNSKLIEKQLLAESEKLNEKSKALRDYLIESISIKELESNINSLITQISRYNSDLNDLQRQISADRTALDILEPKVVDMLASKQEVLSGEFSIDIPIRKQSTGVQPQGSQAVTASITPTEGGYTGIENTMLLIDITEMQTRLVSNEADHKLLTGQIDNMRQQLALLQSTLAEEQYKYASIERECQLAAETYNAYQQLHKQIVISSAADIGKLNISISSSAQTPNSPKGINQTLVISACFILGLFVSIFAVLFKNYWENGA